MEFDLDIGITEEMRAIRDNCRRFALDVMRPLGAKLDRMSPEEVIAKGSPLWDGLERYKKLGLLGMPACYGDEMTPGQRALMHSMVCEELAWGDVGLFITYALYGCAPSIAKAFGRPDLIEFFEARDEICCLALTEPNHGSDSVAFSESLFRDPRIGADLKVTCDGDEFILNGQKSAWVSTGTIAGSGFLFATYEDSKYGRADGVAFLMPFDLPGVSKGKPLDKLGQRTLNQGEIFFDNVRVPRRFSLGDGPEVYPMIWGGTLRDANIAMGQQFVGVARAAFDHALAYAKERVQGGVPIIQHQAVKMRLFDMFRKVESARSHVRRVAIANAETLAAGGVPYPYAATVKVYATQTAFEVASEALQIFGGYGLTKEYPMEKLLRDARASLVEDGENYLLGLMAASYF